MKSDDIEKLARAAQGGPWKLDQFAAYIWAPSEKGGEFPIGDDIGEDHNGIPVMRIRGWGHYTGNGQGGLGLPPEEAVERQRATGLYIAAVSPSTILPILEALEKARKALEPFAAIGDGILNHLPDSAKFPGMAANIAGDLHVPTFGDFRAAKSALGSLAAINDGENL